MSERIMVAIDIKSLEEYDRIFGYRKSDYRT